MLIEDCEFISEESFVIIIESFSQTVEELTFNIEDSEYFKLQNVHNRTFKFLKLKKLYIWAIEFPAWFATSKTLTNFVATIHKGDGQVERQVEEAETQVERVKKLLKQNPKLKVVELRGSTFGAVFDSNFWKNVLFKLDELVVNFHCPPSSLMGHFLETQIQTLKNLSISGGFNLVCLEIIFRMRELKTLYILPFGRRTPWILDWNELTLPQNHSIENLNLLRLGHNESHEIISEAFVGPSIPTGPGFM